MSSSSDSEFEGYLQEFTLVLLTVSVDVDGSDVDTDDLSSDDAADETNDAGGHQEFTETIRNVDILPFRERVGAAHSLPPA